MVPRIERLFRYPSPGAVSSPVSAPQLDSIIHTCKPLAHSLNQHHVGTHKASHYGGARGGCGGTDFGGRRPPGAARQRRQLHGFGGIGSGGGGGIGSGGRIVAAAAEVSGGDTAAALAVLAVAAVAAVRGGADPAGEQCACFAPAAALPGPYSSPAPL